MNDAKGGFKFLMEKLFDESLENSKFMNKIVDNITIMASEFARMAELLVKFNERINQHEQAISLLLSIQNEKNKKDNIMDFSLGSKDEPPTKPN